jgi:hypothetical protein
MRRGGLCPIVYDLTTKDSEGTAATKAWRLAAWKIEDL